MPKQPPKSKAGRPRNTARENIEREFGVTPRRVQQIIREIGLEHVADMGEMRLIEKRVVIALKSLQARREGHELDLAKREVMLISEVRRTGEDIGRVFTQETNDWLTTMPTELAGLDEMHIAIRLRAAITELMRVIMRSIAQIGAAK